jgi:hypothetical protein
MDLTLMPRTVPKSFYSGNEGLFIVFWCRVLRHRGSCSSYFLVHLCDIFQCQPLVFHALVGLQARLAANRYLTLLCVFCAKPHLSLLRDLYLVICDALELDDQERLSGRMSAAVASPFVDKVSETLI